MISILRRGLLVLLAALPLVANAVAAPSAHDLVQDTTNRLLADLAANKEKYKRDPSGFYDSLNSIVGPVVDAEGISKSIMTVKGSNGAIYPVSYTLEKINGEWKLRNVIINGINIGKLFRDQFSDAMQRNGNNLDATINGWAGEVAKAKEKTEAETTQKKPAQ